jgi:hypothetical protein
VVLACVARESHIIIAICSVNEKVPLFTDSDTFGTISAHISYGLIIVNTGKFKSVISIITHVNNFAHFLSSTITVNQSHQPIRHRCAAPLG